MRSFLWIYCRDRARLNGLNYHVGSRHYHGDSLPIKCRLSPDGGQLPGGPSYSPSICFLGSPSDSSLGILDDHDLPGLLSLHLLNLYGWSFLSFSGLLLSLLLLFLRVLSYDAFQVKAREGFKDLSLAFFKTFQKGIISSFTSLILEFCQFLILFDN